jgi:hypothetical protein
VTICCSHQQDPSSYLDISFAGLDGKSFNLENKQVIVLPFKKFKRKNPDLASN